LNQVSAILCSVGLDIKQHLLMNNAELTNKNNCKPLNTALIFPQTPLIMNKMEMSKVQFFT